MLASILLPLVPGSATADDTTINQILTVEAGRSSTIDVRVPPDVTPVRLRGILSVSEPVDGTLSILVNGRLAGKMPARTRRPVSIPVSASDIAAGRVIPVTIRIDEAGPPDCRGEPAYATLSKISLSVTGSERRATSLGTFFPADAERIDIVIPARADDDAIAAGLTAVASLAAKYPATTVVEMRTTAQPPIPGSLGHRVVRFMPGEGEGAQTTLALRDGVQTLILTGSGKDLTDAARALGSPLLAMADSGETRGLSTTLDPAKFDTSRSLADLGAADVRLSGYGSSRYFLGVKQDSFGGPVSDLTLELHGTHTAIPDGTQAQLDVYLDDDLIHSQALGDEINMKSEIKLPGKKLSSESGLDFVLSAVAADGECRADSQRLPIELNIDSETSTFEATRGTSGVSSFTLYPQVFGGELPVAIRSTGAARVTSAIDAAYLVAALQRAAANPLKVSLIDADSLVDGNRSGLLVGANHADSAAVGAPLRFDQMRLVDIAQQEFKVGTDEPFAALESVPHDGRFLVILGSWAPDSGANRAPVLRRVAQRVATLGWGQLRDDLLVASGPGPVFSVSSNAVVPQTERADERRSFARWFFVGIGFLVLLLAIQVFVTMRRDRRIRAVVDAQVRSDQTVEDTDDGPPSKTF